MSEDEVRHNFVDQLAAAQKESGVLQNEGQIYANTLMAMFGCINQIRQGASIKLLDALQADIATALSRYPSKEALEDFIKRVQANVQNEDEARAALRRQGLNL